MGKTQLQLQHLSVDQLRGIKEQLENDGASLQRAYQNLRAARLKFQESKASVDQFRALPVGHRSLIPLSASLYVEGVLTNTDSVVVDVGTGYFIQQSAGRATQYFDRRIASVNTSMDQIAEAIGNVGRQQQAVMDVMKQKVQARMQAEGEVAK